MCPKSVRKVLSQATADPPSIERIEELHEHLEEVRGLFQSCEGNLVRVHEELQSQEIRVAYSTLTSFCRRHQIGVQPKQVAGQYHFLPGEEMQHDTSPHHPVIGDQRRLVHCASLILCYSRLLFAQVYPKFNRFWCKVFLTEALRYFGGAAQRCMLDNCNIVIAHGTGKNAVPAPEMTAFSEHFGFTFVAHALGNTNRSARVERPFDFMEHNFYPGRSFTDVADCNHQFRAWCDKVNATRKRHLHASPRELFVTESPALRRLPIHIPDPAEVAQRTVDALGFVTIHANSYSVPVALLDRQVEVISTAEHVRIFDAHRLVCQHLRRQDGAGQRALLPEHQAERRRIPPLRETPSPYEESLSAAGPEFAELAAQLKSRHPGRSVRSLRQLHQLYIDYPSEPLRDAIRCALDHNLYDLDRIETMVLQSLRGAFFRDPPPPEPRDPDLISSPPPIPSCSDNSSLEVDYAEEENPISPIPKQR